MNKKISVGTALAIVFIAIAAAVAVTMSVSISIYNKLIEDLPGRSQMYSSISELDDLVRKEFYGDINSDKLSSKTAAGYISGLGDPNSRYMTAEEYLAYYNELQGKVYGIGARTCLDPDTGYIYVADVFEESPAYSSGLRAGDKITHVNGVKASGANYVELSAELTGKKLSTVKLKYLRAGQETEISVVKGNSGQSVFMEEIGEVACIKITGFYSNTPAQLEAALKKVESSNLLKSMVIDLRGCSEGNIEYALRALDLIVPLAAEGESSMATVVDKAGKEIQNYASDADDFTIPAIVLINGETAGPAEIFACDIKNFGKAQLLGEKTKGVGTAQKVYQLKDGSAVLLTIGEILPYKSESYNEVGIKPDYEVVMPAEQTARLELLTTDADIQLSEALKLIGESSEA